MHPREPVFVAARAGLVIGRHGCAIGAGTAVGAAVAVYVRGVVVPDDLAAFGIDR